MHDLLYQKIYLQFLVQSMYNAIFRLKTIENIDENTIITWFIDIFAILTLLNIIGGSYEQSRFY